MRGSTGRLMFLAATAALGAFVFSHVPAMQAAQEDDTVVKVKEGQKAPDVELPATQIEKVLPDKKDAKTMRLKDLEGKKNVVLYFFPKALTGG